MKKMKPIELVVIVTILVISLFLNLIQIGKESYGMIYYAATVKSMLMDWKNFIFVSFDPKGFVSVDKPPMGLWIQALSAAIFGYSGWSLHIPQAIAGVASVGLLFHIVRKAFGNVSAIIAAFIFAVTPIFVAVNRSNEFESLLVLVILIASNFLIDAVKKKSLKLLSISMMSIGIGFNILLFMSYMVLPAFFIVYFFRSSLKIKDKIIHLSVAFLIIIGVSLPWFIGVDLIPADSRPYIGSTQNNSEIELSIFNNGLRRILPEGTFAKIAGYSEETNKYQKMISSNDQQNIKGNILFSMVNADTGEPGLMRLFSKEMAGQVSWLIPIILLGVFPSIFIAYKGDCRNDKLNQLLFWYAWLVPLMIFFSFTHGIIGRHYLVLLAAPVAALSSISIISLYEIYRKNNLFWWMLPITLILGVAAQVGLLSRYSTLNYKLRNIIMTLSIISSIVLSLLHIFKKLNKSRLIYTSLITGVIALLIAPCFWSLTPIRYVGEAIAPYAGPELGDNQTRMSILLSEMVKAVDYGLYKPFNYVKNHQQNEKYIVAVPNSYLAAPIIIGSSAAVMTYGGYSGADRILTVDKLDKLVNDGEVRYFMIMPELDMQPEITKWIEEHGTEVPASEWQIDTVRNANSNSSNEMSKILLYDCLPDSKVK